MPETILIGVAWPFPNGSLHLGQIAGEDIGLREFIQHRCAAALQREIVGRRSREGQPSADVLYIPIKTLQQRVGDMIRRQTGANFEYETLELNQATLRVGSVSDVKRTVH
jgi:hypothetical protein